MPMHRCRQSAAGGTSQRLNLGPAMLRCLSSRPGRFVKDGGLDTRRVIPHRGLVEPDRRVWMDTPASEAGPKPTASRAGSGSDDQV